MNFPLKVAKAGLGLFSAAAGATSGAVAVADPTGSGRYTARLAAMPAISASSITAYHLWSIYEESLWSELVEVLFHTPYEAWKYEVANPILGEAQLHIE